MTVAIDLAELPDPDVIEALDLESIITDIKDYLIALDSSYATVLDLESEPMVKLIEALAYRELLMRARYNDEARALLLAKATGSDLDHIAYTYFRQATRLVITEEDLDATPAVDEVLESDDAFRRRVALKPESYSTAGPTDAYIYHSLSASGLVKDASCTSPVPGTTLVTILSTDGQGIPTAELLETVEAALQDGQVRPLSEEVVVQPVTIITYAIQCELWVYAGPDNSLVASAAETELSTYTTARHMLGNSVALSGLHAAAHRPGVQRAVVTITGAELLNEIIVVDDFSSAYCTSITVTVAGVAQ